MNTYWLFHMTSNAFIKGLLYRNLPNHLCKTVSLALGTHKSNVKSLSICVFSHQAVSQVVVFQVEGDRTRKCVLAAHLYPASMGLTPARSTLVTRKSLGSALYLLQASWDLSSVCLSQYVWSFCHATWHAFTAKGTTQSLHAKCQSTSVQRSPVHSTLGTCCVSSVMVVCQEL